MTKQERNDRALVEDLAESVKIALAILRDTKSVFQVHEATGLSTTTIYNMLNAIKARQMPISRHSEIGTVKTLIEAAGMTMTISRGRVRLGLKAA